MAKKTKKTTISKTLKTKPKATQSSYLRFGESYTSLILGIIVVIVAIVLALGIFRNRNLGQVSSTSTQNLSDQTPQGFQNTVSETITPSPITNKKESEYIVQDGDTLWDIAEKEFDSGYNWVDIARANKLSNSDVLNTGDKLIIPKVFIKTAESEPNLYGNDFSQQTSSINTVRGEEKITNNNYVVQAGDSLWNIAVRSFGDGYRWVDIAKANNLSDPDIINEGTQLKLPRI